MIKNYIPVSIDVYYVFERVEFRNDIFDRSSYFVKIIITYSNGTKRRFQSSVLDFNEYIKVQNIVTEKDRFDFVMSDLFQLKFFDYI